MSLYNHAFVNNAATIYFYKSSRKNAKILKIMNIYHLISPSDDRKISPDRLKDEFLRILEYLSYYTAAGHIDIAVGCNEWKNAIINGEKDTQSWYWTTGRIHFDGFTTAAHWLYFNLFCRIYPYCKIDFTEIETDPNYKHLKKEWDKNVR